MAQPRTTKKRGRTVLEKRRAKREKRAAKAVTRRKQDRLQSPSGG